MTNEVPTDFTLALNTSIRLEFEQVHVRTRAEEGTMIEVEQPYGNSFMIFSNSLRSKSANQLSRVQQ